MKIEIQLSEGKTDKINYEVDITKIQKRCNTKQKYRGYYNNRR
jgi:hypothetical protein